MKTGQNLGKPFFIIKEIGFNLEIPDIFNDIEIIANIERDLDKISENGDEIINLIKKWN